MNLAYELIDVVHGYGGAPVLDIPRLTVERGGITGLVGPNGAGKTTLLHLLAFVEPPDQGHIHFFGEPAAKRSAVALRRRVGLVPQNPYLLRGSVRENVELGLKLRRVQGGDRAERTGRALRQVGISHLAERPARSLSGGEAQKVALARALVLAPDVLLLDEPFTHLDPASVDELEGLIAAISRDEGQTVVFTTHDRVRGQALAGKVLGLVAGHLMATSLVNLFRGQVDPERGVFDTGRMLIDLPGGIAAGSHLAIQPDEIVLSREPLHSSMRNSVCGRVTAIAEENGRVRVSVTAEERFQAVVTRASVAEQGIELGAQIWVSFKSTAVEVF